MKSVFQQLNKIGFCYIPIRRMKLLLFSLGPCAPVNVRTTLVCDNNTAAVSWQPSVGAVSYKVTALGRNGDIRQCTTNDTGCNLPNLVCAQTYVVTVSPYSSSCKGIDSYPYNYISGETHHNNSQSQLHFVFCIAVFNFTCFNNASVYMYHYVCSLVYLLCYHLGLNLSACTQNPKSMQ